MKEQVEDLEHAVLLCVDRLADFFEQPPMSGHDAYDKMIFKWTFEHKGEPVQVHMLKTLNGGYALATADFGKDGLYAREWKKENKGIWKKAKNIVMTTAGVKNVYVGPNAVDEYV